MFSWLRGQPGEDASPDDYEWIPPSHASTPHTPPQQPPQPGHPLKLVGHNASTGEFQLHQEALQVLRSVKGPIGVVALCGRARQGKSYILNQLLGKSAGFQVASTHRPCTKGLWMWSHPLPREAPDGSAYHLVLLDTEGIGAYDQTGQYSTQIFSLAVLLSSLFVYNQMGGIDEASIDQLALVAEMSKKIMMNSGGQTNSGPAQYSPSFLWLLRDFYLDLVEDGQKIGPNEYLEIALRQTTNSNISSHARNQTRESIKNLFPLRECATLVRPVNDEDDLKSLDSMDQNKLRPEFSKGVNDLVVKIFKSALPKCLGEHVLSGVSLAALAEAYVQAINNGAVPVISSAWQSVAQAECLKATDEAEKKYTAVFSQDVLANEEDLNKEHTRALSEAKSLYYTLAIGDQATKEYFAGRLEESLSKAYAVKKESKLAEAMAEVDSLLSKANADLQKAINGGISPRNLQNQMKTFVDEYIEFAVGPTKWQSLCSFLQDVYGSTLIEWLDDIKGGIEKAQSDADGLKRELLELRSQLESSERNLRSTQLELRDAAQQTSSEKLREQALGQEITSLKNSLSRLEKDLSLVKLREEEWKQQSEKTEHALLESQQLLAEARERASAKDQELDAVREDHLRKAREWEQERDSRERLHRQEVAGKSADGERNLQAVDAARSEAARSSLELSDVRLECKELERRNNQLVAERAELLRKLQETASNGTRAEEDMARINAEKVRAEHELNETEAKLAKLRKEAQAAIHQKQLDVAETAERLEHEQRRSRELALLNAELQQRIEKLEHQLSEALRSSEASENSAKRKRTNCPAISPSAGIGNGADSIACGSESDTRKKSSAAESMTINEIKQWLISRGHEKIVYDMSASKQRVKKCEWVAVIKKRMELGHEPDARE